MQGAAGPWGGLWRAVANSVLLRSSHTCTAKGRPKLASADEHRLLCQ